MTEQEKRKCDEAVDFFVKQHDDNPDCPRDYYQCMCSFSQTVRGIVEWWIAKKKSA